MAGHRDEEAAGSIHEFDGSIERYHDDPDEQTDDETAADAPLRPSERQSAEYDDFANGGLPHDRTVASRIPLTKASVGGSSDLGPKPPECTPSHAHFPKDQHAWPLSLDRYVRLRCTAGSYSMPPRRALLVSSELLLSRFPAAAPHASRLPGPLLEKKKTAAAA